MMNLRRSDSLPARLRDITEDKPPNNTEKLYENIPESQTEQNFNDISKDDLVATWKSLQSDVHKIKNGSSRNGKRIVREESKYNAISGGIQKALIVNKNDAKKKTTYDNRISNSRDADRSSSFPLDMVQENKKSQASTTIKQDRSNSTARRRSLLDRLISWRTRDCDCRLPKKRNCICTCTQVNGNAAAKATLFAERGRSKSVGYVPQRQVAQFRRCNSAAATVGSAAALRQRAALTLARRYYPEGGWGWTVTAVGAIVHAIAYGLQLGGATGPMASSASVIFHVPPLYTYGECFCIYFNC